MALGDEIVDQRQDVNSKVVWLAVFSLIHWEGGIVQKHGWGNWGWHTG
jgi:hypothetical protein